MFACPRPPLRLLALAVSTGLALGLPATAVARSSGGNTAPGPAPLAMTSETIQWSSDPQLPTNCLTEDDLDTRYFSGALNGGVTTGYHLCDLNINGFTAGGIGLETDAWVVGSLSDLSITAPDGTVHHAVLMGASTSKGVTTYHYAACYSPAYYLATDTSASPLPGGAWQIAIHGQLSSASWVTTAQMTDVTFQRNHCPTSEQNLR